MFHQKVKLYHIIEGTQHNEEPNGEEKSITVKSNILVCYIWPLSKVTYLTIIPYEA